MRDLQMPKMQHPEIMNLCQVIANAGGTAIIVGGWVRDQLVGSDSKDIDIEVFGIPQPQLAKVLRPLGAVNEDTGKSFSVTIMKIGDLDIDISLPRREVSTGDGHKDFKTIPDHTMTFAEASERRDFTVNAIGFNPLTNEVLDPQNGLTDLTLGFLRHVGKQFADDPLRPLRGMQFGGRFNMLMALDTIEMCQSLKDKFHTLPSSRLFKEWFKLLGRSMDISMGLDILIQIGWADCFHGLDANLLKSIKEPLGKLEGSQEERFELGLVLVGHFTAMGHDTLEKFMNQIQVPKKTQKAVIETLRIFNHLVKLMKDKSIESAVRMSLGLNLKHSNVGLLKRLIKTLKDERVPLVVQAIDNVALDELKPKVTGKDLLDKGFKGKMLGEMLKNLHINQLENGLSREDLLEFV